MAKKNKKKSGRPVVVDGDFSTASNGLSGNRVFVSMAKTINIGNYESIRVEYGIGRTVDDGGKFARVMDECHKDAAMCLKEMVDTVEASI